MRRAEAGGDPSAAAAAAAAGAGYGDDLDDDTRIISGTERIMAYLQKNFGLDRHAAARAAWAEEDDDDDSDNDEDSEGQEDEAGGEAASGQGVVRRLSLSSARR